MIEEDAAAFEAVEQKSTVPEDKRKGRVLGAAFLHFLRGG